MSILLEGETHSDDVILKLERADGSIVLRLAYPNGKNIGGTLIARITSEGIRRICCGGAPVYDNFATDNMGRIKDITA